MDEICHIGRGEGCALYLGFERFLCSEGRGGGGLGLYLGFARMILTAQTFSPLSCASLKHFYPCISLLHVPLGTLVVVI